MPSSAIKNSNLRVSAILGVTLLLLIFLSLCIGAESISTVFSEGHWDLLVHLRLPRVLTAAFCGAAMAAAGALSQTLFRNALATPSILGTEAGAGLGLALCAASVGLYADHLMVMVSCMAGAIAATAVSLKLASGNQPLTKLLLGGFALNALLAAITAMITGWLMESGQGTTIYHWLLGSFSARTWMHVGLVGCCLVVGLGASLRVAHALDLLALGDESATMSGVPVPRLRLMTLVWIAVLVGGSISVGGSLPFVGLVVPHFIRLQTGPHLKPLIIHGALGGAALVLLADIGARTLRAPIELDVGLLTTILGAPYFLWLLQRESSP